MTSPIHHAVHGLSTDEILSDDEFKNMLLGAIPRLKAFARKLSGSADMAEDLVQDTMLSAWAARNRFRKGSNFGAWTSTILKNRFIGKVRQRRHVSDWVDLSDDTRLSINATQHQSLVLADVLALLHLMPPSHREALVLVGAGGVKYEEAARLLGVAVGTVKSRVSRARTFLSEMMEKGSAPHHHSDDGAEAGPATRILEYLDKLLQQSATFHADRHYSPAIN